MQDPERPDSAIPQFESAEYKDQAHSDQCAFCHQPIGGQYYRVNGAMACGSCADMASRQALPNSHAAFVRALTFGIGAAIVGLAAYAAFGIMTGWVIGYLSLGVGYIIAWAMMKGSHGRGGRKYQITAAILTYAAVSLAAIPIAIADQIHERKEQRQHQVQQQSDPATTSPAAEPPKGSAEPASMTDAGAQDDHRMGFGAAVAYLLMIGLASPFLELQDPLHGVIGLVILFVGIRIAWRMTAGSPAVGIDGPYQNTATT